MQTEPHSYFKALSPFRRKAYSNSYACAGLKPSCELCPSYDTGLSNEDQGHKDWILDTDELRRITDATKTHNWVVPAYMDMYTSDFDPELREALRREVGKQSDQNFFFLTKNLSAMMEEWGAYENITWSYSASNQDELNFLAAIRNHKSGFYPPQRSDIKEALFLMPLISPVEIPVGLFDHIGMIVVDGFRDSNSYMGTKKFKLEWLLDIQEQVNKINSEIPVIVEGIGDHPSFGIFSISTNKKKFHHKKVDTLLDYLALDPAT